ncbi:hypothetical protein HDF22_004889 [Mucilaginibacter lappiensis]|uniref:Uncharacterized protein n=1 Tax=Mucilaginibacter lappiensis TaxID=354630 RepID=A0A841JJT8_9SPHI|nr:hypothetical protein [Mucilaginibacter lappiensis]
MTIYTLPIGWIDTSMIHLFNLAIERQVQNVVRQLSAEYMYHDTVLFTIGSEHLIPGEILLMARSPLVFVRFTGKDLAML